MYVHSFDKTITAAEGALVLSSFRCTERPLRRVTTILSLRLYWEDFSIQDSLQVTNRILPGLHIYTAGVGIQQLFIIIFALFAIKLHMVLLRDEGLTQKPKSRALLLLYTLYAVLAMVTVCPLLSTIRPSEFQMTNISLPSPATHNLPPLRVLRGTQEHHPQPRGVSVLSWLFAYAVCINTPGRRMGLLLTSSIPRKPNWAK